MKILDFHTHVFPENVAAKVVAQLFDYYGIPLQGKGTIEDLKLSLTEAENDVHPTGSLTAAAVTFSTATKPTQVEAINNFVASVANNESIFGFGTLHPEYGDIEQELERIISLGLKGLKFHADFQGFDIDCPEMLRIYKAVDELMLKGHNLPIILHIGDEKTDHSHPRRLHNIAERFPRLTLIAAHFGCYSVWDDYKILTGSHVYLDTSSSFGHMPEGLAERIITEHGTDKILFATDYPLMKIRGELKKIDDVFTALKLTEQEKENILFRNGYRILGVY